MRIRTWYNYKCKEVIHMDIWGKIGVIVGALTLIRLLTKDIIEWKEKKKKAKTSKKKRNRRKK